MHVIASEDNVVLGLLYQDQEMKSLFRAFPEVLFVDATYRTNNRQMALYLLVVEDGNGESEVVGVWLLRDETSETIRSAVSTFCNDNPQYDQVRCIMADKDFVERDAFAASFPQVINHVAVYTDLVCCKVDETVLSELIDHTGFLSTQHLQHHPLPSDRHRNVLWPHRVKSVDKPSRYVEFVSQTENIILYCNCMLKLQYFHTFVSHRHIVSHR